ncbi:cytochrome P450 [Pestalotiopsis sp. NC0098]|nr:cytochrome P450 [Pestalotiopsis sp. NC0098]
MALLFYVDPAISIAVLLGFTVSWILSRASAGRSIPKVASSKCGVASRKDFADHGMEIIQKGFDHVKSGVFRVTSLDGSDLVILAPKHWLHLCKKKDDEIAPAREEVSLSIASPTVRSLSKFYQFFRCSLHGAAFDQPYLYTYVNARMQGFGDLFTPEVADIFDKYVDALIPLMQKLTTQRPLMARLTAYLSDEVRQVDRQLKQMTTLFTPTLEKCANDIEQGLEHSSVNNEWFEDLVRLAPCEKRRDFQFLTNIFMGFAFTFIFSPVPVTTQIIYEFAYRPEYAELVLKEAREVLGERQDDWTFPREDIRRLSLLDSFCKETHKHHPTAATLANGIVLPAGTVFEVVEIAAHLANPAFENPAEWDGRRYFDLRQKASSAGASTSKYDWGAATRDDLNFG